MEIRFTKEQQAILDAEGDIIISAAAGSGKTDIMTRKIANRVAQGTPLSQMLIVTFTKAATAEMKSRIEERLYELAEKADDDVYKNYLFEQAGNVHNANISTIDSFAADVFSTHFFEFDYPHNSAVADDAFTATLLDDSLSEAVGAYIEEHPGADPFSLFGNEKNFRQTILAIVKKVRQLPDGVQWFENATAKHDESYNPEIGTEGLLIMQEAYYSLKKARECAEDMKRYAECRKQEDFADMRCDHIQSVLDSADFTEFCSLLSTPLVTISKLKGYKDDVAQSEEYKAANSKSAKLFKNAAEVLKYLDNYKDIIMLQRDSAYMMRDIVLDVCERFAEKKRKRGILDYTDLEQFALQVMRDETKAQVYREKFRYVFVDEYQDTSPLQDEIIDHLLRGDNSFFVGDVKQSIYRFRDADPELFLKKLKRYGARTDGQHRFELRGNFRSTNAVVSFANAIFANVMTERTGGVDYDESNALVKLRKDDSAATDGRIHIHFIKKEEPEEETTEQADLSDTEEVTEPASSLDENIEEIADATAQARYTAEQIKKLLETEFWDRGQTKRKYTFSDIAILMFSAKKTSAFFLEELSREGIPLFFESKGQLFNTLEVLLFMSLLHIVDNKRQDIHLLSVMRSCVGNFDMDEIVAIRADGLRHSPAGFGCDMTDCLLYASEKGNAKVTDFLKRIEYWQEMVRVTPMSEFVRMLMTQSGLYRYVSVLPDGKTRCKNLDRLACMAEGVPTDCSVSQLIELFEGQTNFDITSSASDASRDAVTLITEHKSKGLQYNVVIIPDLSDQLISVPASKQYVHTSKDSIGYKMRLGGIVTESLFYKLNLLKEHQALIADRLRLMYVALTRAKDSMILISCGKDQGKSLLKIMTDSSGNTDEYILNRKTVKSIEIIAIALYGAGKADALLQGLSNGYAENDLYSCSSSYIRDHAITPFVPDPETYERAIAELDAHSSEEVDLTLSVEYPYPDATITPAKGSVTGFAHAAATYSIGAKSERKEEEYTGVLPVERGTATHLIFELIPFEDQTEKSVRAFADFLVTRGLLTLRELEAVSIKNIAAFFRRPMFERMRKSKTLYREKEFICFVEARRVVPYSESDELVMLQGVIDCCFLENDKWILLDYKTDTVDPGDEEGLIRKAQTHRKQLELYAYVLEKISGKPVAEAYISFVNAHEVRVF